MGLIVQKFGGTSVADVTRIINVADKVKAELDKGSKVVLVISAMAGVTTTLVNYCREISPLITQNELAIADFTISNGENISSGLVALALQSQGISAIALQGWQAGIVTDAQHSRGLINDINTENINKYLAQNLVPVICGFQGISTDGKITTLGRGGSDITAAAIAAKLKADRCDIYTDVSGVYSADPRAVHNAHKITTIDYDSMLEFSYCGAKVLHPRSVEIAKEYKLDLRVISSFDQIKGTQIIDLDTMEESKIVGIAQNKNILLAKISSSSITSNILLKALLDEKIKLQLSFVEGDKFSIITPIEEFNKVEALLNKFKPLELIEDFQLKTNVSMVNIIGARLLNQDHFIHSIISQIQALPIIWLQIENSKISILTLEEHSDEMVKSLHNMIFKQ